MLGLFKTYVSRSGITVIGNRPMFEDSEDETLGRDIKAKFLEVFGYYPVLDIGEKWEVEPEDYEDGPTVLRNYHVMIDTELLDVEIYGLSYVQFLFERILKERMEKPDAVELSTYASKKYCFSDTEDWWTEITLKSEGLPEGRERFTLMVELG